MSLASLEVVEIVARSFIIITHSPAGLADLAVYSLTPASNLKAVGGLLLLPRGAFRVSGGFGFRRFVAVVLLVLVVSVAGLELSLADKVINFASAGVHRSE